MELKEPEDKMEKQPYGTTTPAYRFLMRQADFFGALTFFIILLLVCALIAYTSMFIMNNNVIKDENDLTITTTIYQYNIEKPNYKKSFV